MPAEEHTKKANTAKKKRQWEHVAASERGRGADRATQIKAANSVVARNKGKAKGKSRG